MPGGHPFRAIEIDDLLEASTRKYALCMHINTASIARSLKIPRRTLADHFTRNPDLRRRLRVVKNSGHSFKTPEIHRAYERAALQIKAADDLPCAQNLIPHLGVSRPQIFRYMRTHGELAKRIGFVTDVAARVWREGKEIAKSGLPVLKRDLADRAGIHYSTLLNVLKANPTFEAELGIEWDSRKLRAWNVKNRPRRPRVQKKKH
jgi:hypothetical protein